MRFGAPGPIHTRNGTIDCFTEFEDPDGDELTVVYTFGDSTGATHQSTDSVWMRSGLSVGDTVFCSATATDPDGLSVEAHFIPYTLPQNDAYFLP